MDPRTWSDPPRDHFHRHTTPADEHAACPCTCGRTCALHYFNSWSQGLSKPPLPYAYVAPRHLTTQVFDPPNFATVAPMHVKARPRHDTHDSTCLACEGGRWRKCGLSAVLNVDKAVNLTGERMSGGRAAVVDLRA